MGCQVVGYLESQDFRLDERKWLSIDLDEALSFSAVGDGGGCLLLAEALDTLGGRHGCDFMSEQSGRGSNWRVEIESGSRR